MAFLAVVACDVRLAAADLLKHLEVADAGHA